jgi:hypothetical protein
MIKDKYGTESRAPFLMVREKGLFLCTGKMKSLLLNQRITVMFFSQLWTGNCNCPQHAIKSVPVTWQGKALTGPSLLLLTVMFVLTTAAGCATPRVQPADPQLLFKSDLLSFLQDEVTKREEVLLKLGIPSAQIEGDRILMYQLKTDKDGSWHLVAPGWNATTGLRVWGQGTMSLVLVFGEDGVLRRHSLVTAQ